MSHQRRVVDSWCPTHAMTIHAVGDDLRRRCILCLQELTAEIKTDAQAPRRKSQRVKR